MNRPIIPILFFALAVVVCVWAAVILSGTDWPGNTDQLAVVAIGAIAAAHFVERVWPRA